MQKAALMETPTKISYENLNTAYMHFNAALFDNSLPPCLITLQRRNNVFGYFAPKRFSAHYDDSTIDEIALNPACFHERTAREVLSTLAHDMVHVWQEHCGTAPRRGYHNKEWASKMRSIGLIPSDTGKEGGKETGQKMSHYIDPQGAFMRASSVLLEKGFTLPYVDSIEETARQNLARKKAQSKTKYVCESCTVKAWAKPDTRIVCGTCEKPMLAHPIKEATA